MIDFVTALMFTASIAVLLWMTWVSVQRDRRGT